MARRRVAQPRNLNSMKHGFSTQLFCWFDFEIFFARENLSAAESPLVVQAEDPIRMMDKEGF